MTVAQGARRTAVQVVGVVALAVAVAAFLSVAAVRHGFFDLKVYYGALDFWVHDHGEIYDYLKPGTQYGFTYPPFAALVMLPMAYLPWPAAITVSVAASVVVSTVLIWWLLDPVSRRAGWTRWFALAVALCLAAAYEPMRETVNFGQVNMLLLFLVAVDLLRLLPAGNRWAGVGIGLATAIKLTPGVFIVYLLVTRRWRAAFTSMAAATAATLAAAALFPDASREFWTSALWNTGRVGELAFVSNQSLRGVVARLNPEHPSTLAWLALVLATLAVWAWRCRAASAVGDQATGLALTGALMCLVSPVTWVHHLVWLIPGLILLVDNAVAAPARSLRRRALAGFAVIAYGLLCSRIVWAWEKDFSGVDGFLGSNTYVWISLALLVLLPIRRTAAPAGLPGPGRAGPTGSAVEPADVPELVEVERGTPAGERHRVGRPLSVG
ncbi:alpha-1,2-mannosyltransferase [Micromonospora halophytica]|uniref:Alpha-1,2-mannosyltransferase n=1 Tax=Micromonospora halophytica TaxID=47864 RepID=A0A1C5I399_9ACTN|nr:alpha-1,2-mannosyltransferase [Micromonospora halophytica]